MWSFYYDVVAEASPPPKDMAVFVAVLVVTGLIILVPSFLEKRRK